MRRRTILASVPLGGLSAGCISAIGMSGQSNDCPDHVPENQSSVTPTAPAAPDIKLYSDNQKTPVEVSIEVRRDCDRETVLAERFTLQPGGDESFRNPFLNRVEYSLTVRTHEGEDSLVHEYQWDGESYNIDRLIIYITERNRYSEGTIGDYLISHKPCLEYI
jgi:hypothetical protein